MNWIEEYRTKMGMSRAAFATAITRQLGGRGEGRLTVPATLIRILEEHPNPRTSPKLMNLIARACGATKAQRDMFLHPSRRGYPYTHSPAAVKGKGEEPWRSLPGATTDAARESARRYAYGRKPVVVIDREGNVVHRAASALDAAVWAECGKSAVAERCMRRVEKEFYGGMRYTFRYAAEWDNLSPTAKALEVREALRRTESGYQYQAREEVVVVDQRGRERSRYENVHSAVRGERVTKQTIYNRCRRKIEKEFTSYRDTTYRFAREWDKMSEAERKKDVGAAM